MTNPAETPKATTPGPWHDGTIDPYEVQRVLSADGTCVALCVKPEDVALIVLACNSHARLTRERDELRKAADDLAFALEAVNVQLEMWGKQSPIAVDNILSRYRSTLQSLKQGEG